MATKKSVENVTELKKTERKPPDLRTILPDIVVSGHVQAEIKRIVGYLHSTAGEVTATDIAQLRELAAITNRQRDAEKMAEEAKVSGDVDAWLKLCRVLDGLTSQRRGLLRDLKLTRNMQAESAETANQRKAQQRSGDKWEGIL